MKLFNLYIAITIAVVVSSCMKKDLNTHGPIENDGIKPGIVSDVIVENLPGAAKLTYKLPADKDLQYVMAEYSNNEVDSRKVKTSRYSDTLFLDGFSRAKEYKVKIYAVDKGENISEPVEVTVHPTTPPYLNISSSVNLVDDFGGVTVSFKNENEDKFALVVLARDNNGEFTPAETFYTSMDSGSFAVRGFDTIARDFGVYIKDRWNNISDTVFKTIHPIYEQMLDKTKFREYRLPNDQESAWGWAMPGLWDGVLGVDGNGFHTAQGAQPTPHRFTIDLGAVSKLSRFKILKRTASNGDYLYNHGDPKIWNMWGVAETPNSSGSWDDWNLLMRCESIKPSGLPLGQISDEDMSFAQGPDGLGEEFVFPISAPAVRWVRLEILENWSGTDFFHAHEITFWGDPQ